MDSTNQISWQGRVRHGANQTIGSPNPHPSQQQSPWGGYSLHTQDPNRIPHQTFGRNYSACATGKIYQAIAWRCKGLITLRAVDASGRPRASVGAGPRWRSSRTTTRDPARVRRSQGGGRRRGGTRLCAHPGNRPLKGELTCDKAFTAEGVIVSRDVKNKGSTLKTRVVGLFCTKVIHLLVSPHCKGSRRLNWEKKPKVLHLL